MKQSIYKAHAVPAALLFPFDGFSISGDYDADLNENKTVCKHVGRKKAFGWKIIDVLQAKCCITAKSGKSP